MADANELQGQIAAAIDCEHVDVHGPDGVHFQALIVSGEFEGKSPVQRHQAVYRALDGRMETDVHALSMRTLTPEEWRKEGGGPA